jgi:tetratricopeptide (TPR) repeat protein
MVSYFLPDFARKPVNSLHPSKSMMRLCKAFALLFLLGTSSGQGKTMRTPPGGSDVAPHFGEPYDTFVPHTDQELNEALRLIRAGDMDAAIQLVSRYLETHVESAPTNELMGIALAKQGKLEESVKRFQRAIEINPRQSSAITKLGDVYLAQQKVDLAKAQFLQAISVDPGDRRAHQRLGLIYLDEGDSRRAIDHLEKGLIGTPPDYIGIKTDLADLYNQAKQFEKTVRLLEPVATENCEVGSAHLLLGTARLALGQKESAAESFDRARKLQPDGAASHLAIGVACRNAGDLEQSRGELEQALKAKADWPPAQYQMAETLIAMGRIPEAMTFFSKAASGAPKSTLIRNRIAEVLAGQKKLTEAIGMYEPMRSDGTADVRTYDGMSTTLQLSGKYQEAEEVLKEACEKYKESPYPLYKLGLHYALVRDYDGALRVLAEARRIAPSDPRVVKAMSLAELRRGDLDHAIADARRVSELVADDIGEQFYLATLLDEKKLDAEAAQLYEKVLQRSPSHVSALNNLALVRLRQNNASEATELARRAASLAPENAGVMDTYGWVLYHKGELAPARKTLEGAVAKAGQNSTYRYHLGVVYQHLKLRDEALKQVELALKPTNPFPERDAAIKLAADLRTSSKK